MSVEFAITAFFMTLVLALYILPFKVKQFTGHPVTDFIISRGCWIVATFLLVQTTAVVATLAAANSLDLTQDIFSLTWIIGRAGYIMIIWLFVGTITRTIKLWKEMSENKRMGE
jgi:hypothetical protein